jgi:hypothetical protein
MTVLLLAFPLQDPDPVKISMRVGIVGGIKAPTVKLQIDIEADKIRMMRLENGKEVVTTGVIPEKELEELLKDMQKVWDLPTEDPVGGEDIYGLDTSISIERGEKKWRNGGPGGCVHSASKVHPTEEQKKLFEKLVDRLREAGKKYATR